MARHFRRPKQARTCGTKEKLSKSDALGKARRLEKTDGARMQAYRCINKCQLTSGARAWHVGHRRGHK